MLKPIRNVLPSSWQVQLANELLDGVNSPYLVEIKIRTIDGLCNHLRITLDRNNAGNFLLKQVSSLLTLLQLQPLQLRPSSRNRTHRK